MAIKKSELYSSIWASCDALRGGMDASQYKDYVLVLLFIKYISDKYAGAKYSSIIIPKGASFKDMVALKGKADIGDQINKNVIGKLAKENRLEGVIDVADFNSADKLGSGKEMVDRLTKLIAIFENPALDFSRNLAEGDDLLGDAYEYLMRHFATESGKSKGQFYTPAEVSRVMAKTIGISGIKTSPATTIYDPTCGSGSLLLKIADEAATEVSLFGQEKDVATAAMAIMNMILHGNATAVIEKGQSTLSNPLHIDEKGRLKMFDFVVANPPFSYKAWTTGLTGEKGAIIDKHDLFKDCGIPPRKNGDFAFLLHIIRSMRPEKGKGAVILPHGVLFRGNVEGEIRANIVRRGYIKGIIGLPPNLFYGTGIPACVIILDKEHAAARKGIFIIDASKDFAKDGNKNRLRERDIHKIVDVFTRQLEIPGYSRMVPFTEIEKNEYNLNIPRYIESLETEDIQDIEAHLKGGVPDADLDALKPYWEAYPSLRAVLFKPFGRTGYSALAVVRDEIKKTIFEHPEFIAYGEKVKKAYSEWVKRVRPVLIGISPDVKPRELIKTIAEELLDCFGGLTLIDKYDVYQHLLTYWAETMQDDAHDIFSDGWEAGRGYERDEKKKAWEGRLIPRALVVSRYFDGEQKEIGKLKAEQEDIERRIDEMAEENGGEDGLIEEALNDKGNLTKAGVQKRIKEIEAEEEGGEELKLLRECLSLFEEQAKVKGRLKELEAALEKKIAAKYKALTVDDIKGLIVDGKWPARMENDIQGEMQRISRKLAGRIRDLAERYATTLPEMEKEVKELEGKVKGHLEKMGFSWK